MAEKFKKIDREFLLSDSSLNSYSYRLLSSGYLFDEFKKNPIGYYMHGTEEHPREQGVLVKWEDLRMDGDKVYGKPCINLNHPRGKRTVEEVESGFLNAASFGHIVVVEVSEDPADYLPDQKGPSVKKWFNRECSLVDIPGNYNAVAELYDQNDDPLNLADFSKPQTQKMKQVFLSPEAITRLNLKADPTQEDFNTSLANLAAEAAKVPDLTTRLQTAEQAKVKAEQDLADLKKTTAEKEVKDLLDSALEGKKITAEVRKVFESQYAGRPADLKAVLDAMPSYQGITSQLSAGTGAKKFEGKTWDQLDREGSLEDLKASDINQFKTLYKEKWNKEYAG